MQMTWAEEDTRELAQVDQSPQENLTPQRSKQFDWSEVSPVVLDLQSRPVSLNTPYSPTTLKILDALPNQFYLYGSSEVSGRMETNPYQAPPHFREPFVENTGAFRLQNNLTMGYALTPKDKVQISFFHLMNKYDNFTRFRLDGSSSSFAPSYQRTLLEKDGWQLTGNIQARQTITNTNATSGSILPSITLVKGFRKAGYAYLNTALDLGRNHFAIGGIDTITPSATLGYGWQMPYDSQNVWLKPLGGLNITASGTYSFSTVSTAEFPSPSNFQSYFLTAEVAMPVYQNAPVSLFCRSEAIFNTGHDRNAFGVSGVNYRLFGGLRVSANKNAVFPRPLPYANQNKSNLK
ncbi:MAG: hypothetical protein K2X66_17045 [Cyanobacteria bacterium]|nr:hypothetical protein [Cyanobacteriota bacterium]